MTVIMDVWRCLDKDGVKQRRGNVEQRRLHELRREAPQICAQIDDFAQSIFFGQAGFRSVDDELSLDQLLIQQAEALIPIAIKEYSHGTLVDDRPIYWGRIFTQYFFNWFNRASVSRVARTELCSIHETTSRHYANRSAKTAPLDEPRVLLTAFDPFLLNSNIKQSNPSTSVALTLAEMYGDSVPIEVFIFPVRYRDFNKGVVERVLKPRFERDPLFMLTLSMGRDNFELERFVGRRRSVPALDNLDYTPVKNGKNPPCLTKCPEFLEFRLPAEILVDIQGQWKVGDNRVVATQSRGEFEATSLDELEGEICVRGSGGGFLSNEIAYRTRLLQLNMGKSFPLGHLHLPRISRFWPAEMWKMVSQTSRILDRLLEYVS